MKKEPLYNFGISQDDVLAENKALNFKSGDNLLCVASAGEVPLNILARHDIKIDAVDIAVNQLHLCYLKLAAIRQLEPAEAASFLGFTDVTTSKRTLLFSKIAKELPREALTFWINNYKTIEAGVIRQARFEKYILLFGQLGRIILGKRKLLGLFEMNSIEQQQHYFDRHLGKPLLKMIFKVAFHPGVYKKRGMESSGLQHSGQRDIARFFYKRFRNFCTATLARHNYYLQFTFFAKILFAEALPEYLQEEGVRRIRNSVQLHFHQKSFTDMLLQRPAYYYNKLALSNIGDWMSAQEYQDLLELIAQKTARGTRILSRYIHLNHDLPDQLKAHYDKSNHTEELEKQCRYPFYSLQQLNRI